MSIGVYTQLRMELLRLADDFDRAAYKYQLLLFYYLTDYGLSPPAGEAWGRFVRANAPGSPEFDDGSLWWTALNRGYDCAFVPGGAEAREKYEALATQGIMFLQTIEHLSDFEGLKGVGGLALRMPQESPLASWLQLVFTTATNAYTPRLRPLCAGELRRLTPAESRAVNRGRPRPQWTLAFEVFRISTGIFEASAEAIRVWLDPAAHVSMLGVGRDFDPPLHPIGMVADSPIVLPHPETLAVPEGDRAHETVDGTKPPDSHLKHRPRWIKDDRQLWLGDELLKRLRPTARRQMELLDEFESLGWDKQIELPGSFARDAEGRKAAEDAVYRLNRISKRFTIESEKSYSRFRCRYH